MRVDAVLRAVKWGSSPNVHRLARKQREKGSEKQTINNPVAQVLHRPMAGSFYISAFRNLAFSSSFGACSVGQLCMPVDGTSDSFWWSIARADQGQQINPAN
jgi:hypothetical protein